MTKLIMTSVTKMRMTTNIEYGFKFHLYVIQCQRCSSWRLLKGNVGALGQNLLTAITANVAWRRISVAFPYLLFVSTLRSASSFCCTHTRHFQRSTRPAFRKAFFTTEQRTLKRGFLTCDSCETSQRLDAQIPPNASGSPCQISLSMG